jgi:hypothetical protein
MDADGRPRDSLDRVIPHRLSLIALGRAVPGLMGRFTAIPAGAHDGGAVSCTCGQTVTFPTDVRLIACECERYFLRSGQQVWVANSPVLSRRVDS